MKNQPVGPTHNQFVVFFQRNCPAPVASENGPGPETQAESAQAQDCGGNKDGIGLGNEVNIQRRPETIAAKHKIAAKDDRDQVAQTPGGALTKDGALGEYRRQQPDEAKDAPASADDTLRERFHGQ